MLLLAGAFGLLHLFTFLQGSLIDARGIRSFDNSVYIGVVTHLVGVHFG